MADPEAREVVAALERRPRSEGPGVGSGDELASEEFVAAGLGVSLASVALEVQRYAERVRVDRAADETDLEDAERQVEVDGERDPAAVGPALRHEPDPVALDRLARVGEEGGREDPDAGVGLGVQDAFAIVEDA